MHRLQIPWPVNRVTDLLTLHHMPGRSSFSGRFRAVDTEREPWDRLQQEFEHCLNATICVNLRLHRRNRYVQFGIGRDEAEKCRHAHILAMLKTESRGPGNSGSIAESSIAEATTQFGRVQVTQCNTCEIDETTSFWRTNTSDYSAAL
jgi:hypothetical protein